jgi:Transcriptional regulator containing an amidase domain and an AraC-type DNA-binding HTH domain
LMQINPDRHLQSIDPKQYDNPPTFSQYIAANKQMNLHTIIETRGILYQLMSGFIENAMPKSGNKDQRVNKCLQFIHENINKSISISQLADIACLTEDHFIRIFKKEVKTTPLKYINSKKTEKAQLLLLTTDLPVRDIAFELSIDNISYFNRIFKQHVGKTPSCYRNEYNKIYR